MMDKDVQMRVYIIDSLVARSGSALTPAVISDLADEILGRMIEIHEVRPACKDMQIC